MHVVGLTGGISTGKSTVSNYMQSNGLNVIDADLIARQVVKRGETCYFAVIDTFGPEILADDSQIDRAKLGQIIFNNPEKRKLLNQLVHPTIRLHILSQTLLLFLKGKRVAILDTPLLFESGLHRWVHSTCVVYCSEVTQKQRLMGRDGLNSQDAQSRMNSQMPIDQKRALATHVIDNSNTLSETRKQVDLYIHSLLKPTWIYWLSLLLFYGPCLTAYTGISLVLWIDKCLKVGFIRKRAIPTPPIAQVAPAAE